MGRPATHARNTQNNNTNTHYTTPPTHIAGVPRVGTEEGWRGTERHDFGVERPRTHEGRPLAARPLRQLRYAVHADTLLHVHASISTHAHIACLRGWLLRIPSPLFSLPFFSTFIYLVCPQHAQYRFAHLQVRPFDVQLERDVRAPCLRNLAVCHGHRRGAGHKTDRGALARYARRPHQRAQ